ncbi:MAG: signal peptidase I [Chloroflexota bacterium]
MAVIVVATRVARRTLDALVILVIGLVVATVVVARVIPQLTGGTVFVVGGGSMEPHLPVGAAVVAFPVATEDLRVEQVVSVRVGPQRAVFTHRIIRIVAREDGLWLATQGDANPEPDPSLVRASAVIGRVDWQVPYLGYLVALLGSIPGVAFVVSLSGFLLAGAWLLETLEDDQRAARRRHATGLAAGSAAGSAG